MENRKLIIKFYDNIQREKLFTISDWQKATESVNGNLSRYQDNLKENKISVNYSGLNSTVDIISKDLIGYWKKIVYNIGERSEVGYALEKDIETIIENGVVNRNNLFKSHRPDINIKIVEESFRSNKIYSSSLQTKQGFPFSLVNLKCSRGEENTYAPLTVFSFLHHIVQNLPNSELINLSNILKNYPKGRLSSFM